MWHCGTDDPATRAFTRPGDGGAALIVVLLALSLLLALGSAVVLTTVTETRIWGRHRQAAEAFYMADAALVRAVADLRLVPDWSGLPGGGVLSSFADGPPSGVRTLPGVFLDLTALTSLVRCGRQTSCTEAQIEQTSDDRPWGRANPRWQLYAYGPAGALVPDAPVAGALYAIVWIADDPSETDDVWQIDGGPPAGDPEGINPGREVLRLLAHVYGPLDVHRAIEATVRRTAGGVRLEAWREVR